MLRRMTTLLVGAVLATGLATAGTVFIAPAFQSVLIGTPVSVDLVYTGIPPLVGSFDLDIAWAPAILSLTGLSFGTTLGDLGLFEGVGGGGVVAPGLLDIFEVSFLTIPELAGLQGVGPIVLATLFFDTIGLGVSPVSFSGAPNFELLISDHLGAVIPSAFDGGAVEVTAPSLVPEPGSIVLLLSGAGALLWFRRRAA